MRERAGCRSEQGEGQASRRLSAAAGPGSADAPRRRIPSASVQRGGEPPRVSTRCRRRIRHVPPTGFGVCGFPALHLSQQSEAVAVAVVDASEEEHLSGDGPQGAQRGDCLPAL